MLSAAFISLGSFALTAKGLTFPRQIDLDTFIENQRAISLQGVLDNIGPDGSQAPGVSAGIVIASPSQSDPDYFYTWTRDSALVMKMLVDELELGEDLQTYLDNYVDAQAVIQTVSNPSGDLQPSGLGLGEPKFNVDETAFTDAWGRPQRDGPALRAITLIAYSNWLIDNGSEDAAQNVWPVISNDLSYVGQYWNQTGFDLWEEVQGSSFFTIQNQYRALVEGATLATTLGQTCTACTEQSSNILCFLDQSFWNGAFYTANINQNNGRSGHDANTVLGPISLFDVNAACDDPSIQPCSSKALANFKLYVDAFRSGIYGINDGIPAGSGIALGRYPEDSYYNGNPWYLINAGAAEFLYDAVAQWTQQGSLTVNDTSLAFFQEIYPSATSGTTYASDSDEFTAITDAVWTYADSFVAIIQTYTPDDGSLSEQFDKSSGSQLSASDLTWSYAAFVSMAERRASQFPAKGWVPSPEATVPGSCVAGSTTGTYAPA